MLLISRAERNLLQPIKRTTQIWVVTRHQYGISSVVTQSSFRGKTIGGVTKCRLFSKSTIFLEKGTSTLQHGAFGFHIQLWHSFTI